MNFQKFMIPFWKHRDQEGHLRQVSEEGLSVEIQLPPGEDGDGYHRNIRIKMWVFLNSFNLFLMSSTNTYKNIHSQYFDCFDP